MDDDEMRRAILDALRERDQGALESTAALVRTLDRIATRLDDVDRRLMRVESSGNERDLARMASELARLTIEVSTLTTWQAHMTGAMWLFKWVRESWPMFVAIGGAIALYLEFRRRGG